MWLNSAERYWPGNVLEHLKHCTPSTRDGTKLDVPVQIVGKVGALQLPNVNRVETFLTLNVRSITVQTFSTEMHSTPLGLGDCRSQSGNSHKHQGPT
jgi:hypothetical protein